MSRQARRRRCERRRKQERLAQVSDDALIERARELPADERSAWVVEATISDLAHYAAWMLRQYVASDAHRAAWLFACERLRPFVDAGVLDRADAARAARRAVLKADTRRAYRAAQRAGKLDPPGAA